MNKVSNININCHLSFGKNMKRMWNVCKGIMNRFWIGYGMTMEGLWKNYGEIRKNKLVGPLVGQKDAADRRKQKKHNEGLKI